MPARTGGMSRAVTAFRARRGRWALTALTLSAACSSGGPSVVAVPLSTAPPTVSVVAAVAITTDAATTTTVEATTTTLVGDMVPDSQPQGDAAFIGAARVVKAGATRTGYRQFGSGGDIVLIAGEGSGMDTWPITFLRSLAERFRVTMFDGRDLGYSSFAPAGFTLEELADDTVGLISALGLHQPTVFGWSTGGEIALLMAARHPGVAGVYVVSGAEGGRGKSVSAAPAVETCASSEQPSCDLLHMLFSRDTAGKAAADAFVADYLKVPHPPAATEMMRHYVTAEHRYLWSTVVPYDSIVDRVVVMNGDADELVPVQNAQLIVAAMKGRASLQIVAGGAHGWFLQDTTLFLQLLTQYGIGGRA